MRANAQQLDRLTSFPKGKLIKQQYRLQDIGNEQAEHAYLLV